MRRSLAKDLEGIPLQGGSSLRLLSRSTRVWRTWGCCYLKLFPQTVGCVTGLSYEG